jgi:hypothetical protein
MNDYRRNSNRSSRQEIWRFVLINCKNLQAFILLDKAEGFLLQTIVALPYLELFRDKLFPEDKRH